MAPKTAQQISIDFYINFVLLILMIIYSIIITTNNDKKQLKK